MKFYKKRPKKKPPKRDDYTSIYTFSNAIRDKYEGAISAVLVREVFGLIVEFIIDKLINNCQVSINNFGTFTIEPRFSKSINGQKFYKKNIVFVPHESFLKKAFKRKDIYKEIYFAKIGEADVK